MSKILKPKDIGHFLKILISAHARVKCRNSRCWWQESHAAVMQVHF